MQLQAEILAASPAGAIIAAINATFKQKDIMLDAAAFPNPFFGLSPKTFIDSNQTIIALVDGGSDGQVSPIQPMLVKARGVDVIFVSDTVRAILLTSTLTRALTRHPQPADTEDNFTNGSSLIVSSRYNAFACLTVDSFSSSPPRSV